MRSSVRWLVPVTVATVVAGGVMINAAAAGSAPQLPERTPQQVLEAVAGSNVTALSGTVVTHADLGLPSLPQIGGGSGGSAGSTTDPQGLITRFLTGANTLRVWADGPTRQRAQLLDPFDELNVVRNGDEVWTYASKENAAQHRVLPAEPATAQSAATPGTGTSPSPATPSGAQDLTPAQLAQRALAAADPTTTVTLGPPELIAGRSAYTLTLTPKTTATLVGHVVIAVDADKSVPLQVQVFARGSSQPAIESGFTAVDFSTPSADLFTFTPPKGAKVSQLGQGPTAPTGSPSATQATPRPTVTGTGWSSIVELPASAVAGAVGVAAAAKTVGAVAGQLPKGGTDHSGINSPGPGVAAERDTSTPTTPTTPSMPTTPTTPPAGQSVAGQSVAGLLGQLTTPVSGGRAVTSSLLSALITDDGRIFVGAVPVQALIDAAKK